MLSALAGTEIRAFVRFCWWCPPLDILLDGIFDDGCTWIFSKHASAPLFAIIQTHPLQSLDPPQKGAHNEDEDVLVAVGSKEAYEDRIVN